MTFSITMLIHLIEGLIDFLLWFRFLLKLLGANSSAPFVRWIYETSAPLLHPFEGMFPSPHIESFVLDFTTLFALLTYTFALYIISSLVAYIEYETTRRRS